MNKKQTNILSMSYAVDDALAEIVEAHPLPELIAKCDAFKAKVAEIEAHASTQALPITGMTADRKRAFATAIDATLVVADLVRSYARSQKLSDLEAKVRLTRTSFTFTRLAHRVPLMRQVYDAAQSVLPQLAGQGVTAETLAALKTKIDAADTLKAEPRSTVVTRRVATKTLAVLFRELKELLEIDLDPQMNALRDTNLEAWETYRAARDVVNLPRPASPDAEQEDTAAATTKTAASPDKLAA